MVVEFMLLPSLQTHTHMRACARTHTHTHTHTHHFDVFYVLCFSHFTLGLSAVAIKKPRCSSHQSQFSLILLKLLFSAPATDYFFILFYFDSKSIYLKAQSWPSCSSSFLLVTWMRGCRGYSDLQITQNWMK